MAQREMIQVDLTEFRKTAKQIVGNDWPNAVVRAFSDIANDARDAVEGRTRAMFHLHSDYITRGIRFYPKTEQHKDRAMRALTKYGDMNAMVYLRGARSAKHSLEFMVDHEKGGVRKPQHGVKIKRGAGTKDYIAAPTKDLKALGVRTSKGRMRKRYRPSRLLKRFNEVSRFDGVTTRTRKRVRRKRMPGYAFIIKGKKGQLFIVRAERKKISPNDKNLLFMYTLIPKADFEARWGFVDTVWQNVSVRYADRIQASVKKIPDYRNRK